MGNVVAIDAGTTGVRALVVDERARWSTWPTASSPSTSPGPGWVEHDPDRDLARPCEATLAEVGHDSPRPGDTGGRHRDHQPARDRGGVRPRNGEPLHRAIVWQDRRTAARLRRARERPAISPWSAARTGLVLDPYFTATKIT